MRGLFPGEAKVADIVDDVGCAPFGVIVLSQEVAMDFAEDMVLGLIGEHVVSNHLSMVSTF